MRTKVKITKKQIKQDKFTTFMLQAKEWILENWQQLAIGVVAAIVVVVAVVYFVNMQSSKGEEGAVRLTQAVANLNRGNYQEAILELGNIADDYSGRIGGMAQFYLANAHYESRNYDQAIENYQKYIDQCHIDGLTTASAIAGIGACLENKQEFLAAGDKYVEAIKYFPDSPNVPDYYVGAVRNYVSGSDREKMEEILGELNRNFPNSDYSREATRLAMSLRTK
ncbi:MAG: tetratricopeptide repeat protein [Candidatus Zixiibacteriota bacterium]